MESQTLTVRSLEAVYSTPLPSRPPPPHRTTLTEAVCPPRVYSVSRVEVDHTRTVPSFDDDATRGAEGFLQVKISNGILYRLRKTYKCIGSQDKDVTHFECPFSASPIGFPVFGSHSRTFSIFEYIAKEIYSPTRRTYMSIMAPSCKLSLHRLPFNTQNPPFMSRKHMRRCFREQIP